MYLELDERDVRCGSGGVRAQRGRAVACRVTARRAGASGSAPTRMCTAPSWTCDDPASTCGSTASKGGLEGAVGESLGPTSRRTASVSRSHPAEFGEKFSLKLENLTPVEEGAGTSGRAMAALRRRRSNSLCHGRAATS